MAIKQEKLLKNRRREWKDKLVNDFNLESKDLAEHIGCDAEYNYQVNKGCFESSKT